MAKVALCIIATNDYIDFVMKIGGSACKYFLHGHTVDVHLFTNKQDYKFVDGWFDLNSGRTIDIQTHYIEHEQWPAMTLKRYKLMASVDLSDYDYIYYIDADSLFVAPVGDEIFAPLTGVFHPGYYVSKKGDWETREQSTAFVMPCKRKVYLAGGFQGGAKYWQAAKYLSEMIDRDTEAKITAKWHDESHWNKLYTMNKDSFKVLSPAYCMEQNMDKRRNYGIADIEPKILCLDKNHKQYQK